MQNLFSMVTDESVPPITLSSDCHSRQFSNHRYLYPVLSRRSGGLSLGVNLNQDKRCNLACIYCEVNRAIPAKQNYIDISAFHAELSDFLQAYASKSLFEKPSLLNLSEEQRVLKDIAIAGDGEPTSFRNLDQCIQIIDAELAKYHYEETKRTLITNATFFHKNWLHNTLALLAEKNFDIWAKLDAGSQSYMNLVSGTRFPIQKLIDNIALAGKYQAITIQSLFMRIHGAPPPDAEISAYIEKLQYLKKNQAQISRVQIYTVARPPAQTFVSALEMTELERIAELVANETKLLVTVYG